MGLRYTCRLFRTSDAAAFRRSIEDVARGFGGHVDWSQPGRGDEDLRLGSTPTVQTLYLPYGACDWQFFQQISTALNAPLMELRIQEGSLWDYALQLGDKGIDNFSTLPQYWEGPEDTDEEELQRWAGKPKVLADLWQVPLESIDRYLVNWGMQSDPNDSGIYHTLMNGKAYPSDQHPYGECQQMFDFLKALGGVEPLEQNRLVLSPRSARA